MCHYVPAVKVLYPIRVDLGQQEPGSRKLKFLATGVHCTQLKRALRPMATLMVSIANQTATFTQPLEMRSRVSAKDVLLKAAAVREKRPEMYNAIKMGSKSLGRTSEDAFPHPSEIAADVDELARTRQN
jgi:hypothetical protein